MKQGLGTISSIAAGVFGWFKSNGDVISNIFEDLSGVFGTFGKIISRVFGVFIKSTGDGADTLERISNWVNENEAQILAMFLGVTAALLSAADAGATVASVILRGFASVIEVVGNMRGVMYDVFAAIIGYAAKAFGWIPGIGEKLAGAQRGMEQLGDASRNMGSSAAKAAGAPRTASTRTCARASARPVRSSRSSAKPSSRPLRCATPRRRLSGPSRKSATRRTAPVSSSRSGAIRASSQPASRRRSATG